MNRDRIKGNWKQIKGKVKEAVGRATNDDRTTIAGERDQLTGKLQEGYGVAKEKVEKAVGRLTDSL